MSVYLSIISAGEKGYAVGAYDSDTNKASEGNSCFTISFEQAISKISEYGIRNSDFLNIKNGDLSFYEDNALKSLDDLVKSIRERSRNKETKKD